MSDTSENVSLPCGWDTKYDFKTGKRYYINYITKHTSLEDPRLKYKKLQLGDSITVQSYQSSPIRSYSFQPFYHMHQDINFSSGRPSPIMGRSYSPLMGSNAIHYLAQKPQEYPTLESSVAKIKALFPTAGETHIKTLLHKYHYREAVVVSALQVEKHPLTTPGPYSSPLQTARNVISQIAPPASGSPGRFSFSSAFRNLSPRKIPHSSPKMKLRYLKSVFPVVDETVILDTLCSSENNVHKASETLMTMGFMKKSDHSSKLNLKKDEESFFNEKDSKKESIYIPLHDPFPRVKSYEEKSKIKKKLEDKFDKVPERVISLALETADYDEERAEQFLKATVIEDKTNVTTASSCDEKIESDDKDEETVDTIDSFEKPFKDSGIWGKISPGASENKSSVNSSSYSNGESAETANIDEVKSSIPPIITDVNKELPPIQVHNERSVSLISKTGIKLCAKLVPKGANKALLGSRCTSKGANADLVKGPRKGLTKASFLVTKSAISKSFTKDNSSGCIIS